MDRGGTTGVHKGRVSDGPGADAKKRQQLLRRQLLASLQNYTQQAQDPACESVQVPALLVNDLASTLEAAASELEQITGSPEAQSADKQLEIVKPSAWATRELRYNAELAEMRSVIERQRADMSSMTEELEHLRSGEAYASLMVKAQGLEQQVTRLSKEKQQVQQQVQQLEAAVAAAHAHAGHLIRGASGNYTATAHRSGAGAHGDALVQGNSRRSLDSAGATSPRCAEAGMAPGGSGAGGAAEVVVEHLSVKRAKENLAKAGAIQGESMSAGGGNSTPGPGPGRTLSEAGRSAARERAAAAAAGSVFLGSAGGSKDGQRHIEPTEEAASIAASAALLGAAAEDLLRSYGSSELDPLSSQASAAVLAGQSRQQSSPPDFLSADPAQATSGGWLNGAGFLKPEVSEASVQTDAGEGTAAAMQTDMPVPGVCAGTQVEPVLGLVVSVQTDALDLGFLAEGMVEGIAAEVQTDEPSPRVTSEMQTDAPSAVVAGCSQTDAPAAVVAMGMQTEHLQGAAVEVQTESATGVGAGMQTDMPEAGVAAAMQTEGSAAGVAAEVQTDGGTGGVAAEVQTDASAGGVTAEIQTDAAGAGVAAGMQTDDPAAGVAAQMQTDTPSAGVAAQMQTDASSGVAAQMQTDALLEGVAAGIQTEEPEEGVSAFSQTELSGNVAAVGSNVGPATAALGEEETASLDQHKHGAGDWHAQAADPQAEAEEEVAAAMRALAAAAAGDVRGSGTEGSGVTSVGALSEADHPLSALQAHTLHPHDGTTSGSDAGRGQVGDDAASPLAVASRSVRTAGGAGMGAGLAEASAASYQQHGTGLRESDNAVAAAIAAATAAAEAAAAGAAAEQLRSSELASQVQELLGKLSLYEATLERLRTTVEEADAQKELLQEQNLELAERLAEMQAFISYKAQTTKTAGASVGPWLKSHRNKQGPAQGQGHGQDKAQGQQ